MRKNVLLIFGLTIFILVLSCQKNGFEAEVSASAEIEFIEKSQYFYDFVLGSAMLPDPYFEGDPLLEKDRSPELTRSSFSDGIIPDWSSIETDSDNQVSISETRMQLIRPVYYTVLVYEEGDTTSFNTALPHTVLIINEWKQTEKITCAIATLIPDKDYDGDLSRIHANPSGSDFTGIALYSFANGVPGIGFRFKNGKVVYRISFTANEGGSSKEQPGFISERLRWTQERQEG